MDKDNINQNTFETAGQYRKYLKMKSFFERLIELKKDGYIFMVDDDLYKEPYIDGVEMGFKMDGCRIVFVGGTFSYNKKTEECDIPWIDISIKELRQRIYALRSEKISI